jgi:S1-C subfamily serine protease
MLARKVSKSVILIGIVFCCASLSFAQQPQPSKRPARPNSPSTSDGKPAPQVVTIVHRLNGLKMFRMLLRSQQQVEAIARLDDPFNLTDEVHTNIIAGLALDDGQTIVAWLPDAQAEFGPFTFTPTPFEPSPPNMPFAAPTQWPSPGDKAAWYAFRGGMFGTPDLTVIGPDGKRLDVNYVGLDGATGLSILRLAKDTLPNNSQTMTAQSIDEGENVRLLNPEPAASTKPAMTGSLFVRIGTTYGTVQSIKRFTTNGGVARLKVKSARLSLASIGGVAVNDEGETLGIVDSVEGPEATILPTATIRRAARRVLAQRASVPRPWLGVKGQPVSRLSVEQIKNQGWKVERAASLLERQRGILLTSIAPRSPAASALLRAGDVILKVNDEDVENADDFSWMLDDAGPSTSVTFTLARPDHPAEETVKVELSAAMDPSVAFGFSAQPAAFPSLISQGIETVALQPMVAAQLGASSGLLIVYVDPSSTAFAAGLQPGDVIESIDGKPAAPSPSSDIYAGKSSSRFGIVRKKQKLVVTVNDRKQ